MNHATFHTSAASPEVSSTSVVAPFPVILPGRADASPAIGADVVAESRRSETNTVDQISVQLPLDRQNERDWCELVRDIVAIANSGGGQITFARPDSGGEAQALVGRSLDATVGGPDESRHAATEPIDPEEIYVRLARYTGQSLSRWVAISNDGIDGAGLTIRIAPVPLPIGFVENALFPERDDPAELSAVFAAGSFYFRQADRSVPGTTEDLRRFFEPWQRKLKAAWLRQIRQALRTAPEFPSLTEAATPQPAVGGGVMQPVRIVTDPTAPPLQPQDVETLYPWRQKDLLRELKRRIGPAARGLNSYDIQAVRRQYGWDNRRDFVFHLPGAGRRYSRATVDWVVEQFRRTPDLFSAARLADRELLRLRRAKPR